MKHIMRQIAACNLSDKRVATRLRHGLFVGWVVGVSVSLFVIPPSALANGVTWTSDTFGDLEGGVGSRFASSQIAFTLPLERQQSGDEVFNTDVHLDLTEFRWSDTTATTGEYLWLSVPVYYRQKRTSGTELHVRVEPGLMTDLDAMGTENLTANVELSGRRYTGRTSFWQYGIIVNRYFGDRNPRPLLSYATRLTDSTEMLLGFPKTNIQTRWSSDFSTYFRIYPSGGFWREEVDGLAPIKVTDVSYSNWHMGVGGEFRWRDNMWFNAEIGQLRNRQIKATDATGIKVSGTPADNGYWQLGGSLRF